jgi:hypothetical protein
LKSWAAITQRHDTISQKNRDLGLKIHNYGQVSNKEPQGKKEIRKKM